MEQAPKPESQQPEEVKKVLSEGQIYRLFNVVRELTKHYHTMPWKRVETLSRVYELRGALDEICNTFEEEQGALREEYDIEDEEKGDEEFQEKKQKLEKEEQEISERLRKELQEEETRGAEGTYLVIVGPTVFNRRMRLEYSSREEASKAAEEFRRDKRLLLQTLYQKGRLEPESRVQEQMRRDTEEDQEILRNREEKETVLAELKELCKELTANQIGNLLAAASLTKPKGEKLKDFELPPFIRSWRLEALKAILGTANKRKQPKPRPQAHVAKKPRGVK